MYKIYKPRIAILTVLVWLGIVSFPLLTDVKTLAQTQLLQPQCINLEIQKHIQQLGDGNSSAFDVLVKCQSKSVPALNESLTNQDESIRIAAVAALGEIDSSSVLSVPALTDLLRDNSEDVRIIVVNTLEKIGKPGVPALIQALQYNDNWMVRYSAADALGRIGASDEEVVPILINALRDEDKYVSSKAADALRMIRKETPTEENPFVRYEGIRERIECKDVAVMESFNNLAFCVLGSGSQNSTSAVRQVTSNYIKKPPVMCRIPVLRSVFPWKC